MHNDIMVILTRKQVTEIYMVHLNKNIVFLILPV